MACTFTLYAIAYQRVGLEPTMTFRALAAWSASQQDCFRVAYCLPS